LTHCRCVPHVCGFKRDVGVLLADYLVAGISSGPWKCSSAVPGSLFLNGRPGLGFKLDVGVGGDRAMRIGADRHQPEHGPGRRGLLPIPWPLVIARRIGDTGAEPRGCRPGRQSLAAPASATRPGRQSAQAACRAGPTESRRGQASGLLKKVATRADRDA
jgi:hypothetical protein